MEKLSEQSKREKDVKALELVVNSVFADMDWGKINSISAQFQQRAAVNPKEVIPTGVVFTKLEGNMMFSVPNTTALQYNSEEGATLIDKNDLIINCDTENLYEEILCQDLDSGDKIRKFIVESLIHEYCHMISYQDKKLLHSDIKNYEDAIARVQSGTDVFHLYMVDTDEFTMVLKEVGGGRLKEVITEYLAAKIQEKYFHEDNENNLNKRYGSYYDFVKLFDILVRAINKETGVDEEKIREAFLKAYFDGYNLNNSEFMEILPKKIKVMFIEMMKSEREKIHNTPWWERMMKILGEYLDKVGKLR